jgi:type I restriction enzyme, S subunit
LGRVDTGLEHLNRVPDILKRFRQAVLAAATSGELTEDWRSEQGIERTWEAIRVGNKFNSFSGGTPSRAKSEFWNGDIGWLSSGDIKKPFIDKSSETITQIGLKNSSAKICRRGSLIVVVRSGILQHTLPVAILDGDFAINQDIKCFDSGDDQLNLWLGISWRSDQRKILSESREGTTVQSVKYDTLKNWELLVPSKKEQAEIVKRVEALFALAASLEARYKAALSQFEKLTPALLAKAFRGELVPQDPNDEPAALLLERIAASKQAEVKAGAGKGKRVKKPRTVGTEQGILFATEDGESAVKRLAEIDSNHLTQTIQQRSRSDMMLEAKTLWQASELSIDDFYIQLDREVSGGLLHVEGDNPARVKVL